MSNAFLISKWALIRRNELVDIPDKLEIHPDFLRLISQEEFENAFREIGGLFYQMYSDMADAPKGSDYRYTKRMNMTTFPVRQGSREVRHGSHFISCSACLRAAVLRKTYLSQIRRKSER